MATLTVNSLQSAVHSLSPKSRVQSAVGSPIEFRPCVWCFRISRPTTGRRWRGFLPHAPRLVSSVSMTAGITPFLDDQASSDSRYLGARIRIVPLYRDP